MTTDEWKLVIAAAAERSIDRLPSKIAAAVVEFMVGPLVAAPRRVGHPLARELAGPWSARRGAYRIVYELDEDKMRVNVLRIDHRSDIYRPT
ncbi:MAG TPA: type II toxin-antitoxin system RelE/ParE family toxin [Acidimicrobiales bacterium]|nr:type II toxin-antitoxin system RelE/ParE family toxin [Acidimicrobiales bacterium]